MDKKSRGTAIIINNTFKSSSRYVERKSGNDETKIHARLQDFEFEVELKNNLSRDEMLNLLIDTGKNMTESDCFMCIIMSYGEEGIVYGNDEKPIPMKKLMEPFKGDKCKVLAGQPKIFIVQACPPREQNVLDNAENVEYKTQKIPVEADFLTVFSVIPGHLGWESEEKSSWFIGSLSETLDEYYDPLRSQKMDFLRLMTRVNNKVWQKLKSKKHIDLNIPYITSLLTKFIYFPEK